VDLFKKNKGNPEYSICFSKFYGSRLYHILLSVVQFKIPGGKHRLAENAIYNDQLFRDRICLVHLLLYRQHKIEKNISDIDLKLPFLHNDSNHGSQ
jgi:hypothetical protein